MNLSNSTTNIQNAGVATDFSKIRVGVKTLDDAIISLGDYRRINPQLGDKKLIQEAINKCDIFKMREVSRFFMRISGIYSRLVKHLANFYRYDWLLTPYSGNKTSAEKIIEEFNKTLYYLDNFHIKRYLGDVAQSVLINGCYYGYRIHGGDYVAVQELPVDYCRSRFSVRGKPAVEFNMKFFDDAYKNQEVRLRMINAFPPEFKKGYALFKEGKLSPDYPGDSAGWYLLDIESTVKFNIGGVDYPIFMSVIPHLIDLDAAQDLDRRKMAQKLLKIIIQKMPLDKNGDLVFDVDEAAELHNNAVKMLGKAIGIDVLTTFAEVEVADMADKNSVSSIDELEKVERTVYNESGTAQNLFNTDGNIALEKSILDDEASIYNLILQFEEFLNDLIKPFNKNPKKLFFRVEILPTTIYNYKEMSKLYKEQTTLGYSKWLPQIALGKSQSSILATAKFENEVLNLAEIFIPPQSSNTMSSDSLKKGGNGDKNQPSEEKKAGRKEKADDEKSEKTIQNRESMN